MPEIEALKSGKSVGQLPAGAAFDLEVHEDPTQNPTPDTH